MLSVAYAVPEAWLWGSIGAWDGRGRTSPRVPIHASVCIAKTLSTLDVRGDPGGSLVQDRFSLSRFPAVSASPGSWGRPQKLAGEEVS